MMIEDAHAACLIPYLAMMCSQHPHCLIVPRVKQSACPAWAQFCFNGDHGRIEMKQEARTLPWDQNPTISDVLKPLGTVLRCNDVVSARRPRSGCGYGCSFCQRESVL
jgi:hypothetical protein